jgi:hypothetical protein
MCAGVVSTVVQDSAHKIFIGGLPSYLSEDQVCLAKPLMLSQEVLSNTSKWTKGLSWDISIFCSWEILFLVGHFRLCLQIYVRLLLSVVWHLLQRLQGKETFRFCSVLVVAKQERGTGKCTREALIDYQRYTPFFPNSLQGPPLSLFRTNRFDQHNRIGLDNTARSA